jgi:DNA-binding HxlR family transcriptional regulator
MKSHGQFCSVARSLDLLGERWTLLVVRELLMGGRSFGDIRRGIPRISRTMLSARLRELADGGVIESVVGGYALTPAGRELEPVVAALGTWGQRWLPRATPDDELDLDALVWDMHRRVDPARLPTRPVVVRIEASDLRRARPRFLLLRDGEVSLCTTNPGFAESLTLRADRSVLVGWWRGDFDLATARRRGLALDGPPALVRAFAGWFERYLFAAVPPAA